MNPTTEQLVFKEVSLQKAQKNVESFPSLLGVTEQSHTS